MVPSEHRKQERSEAGATKGSPHVEVCLVLEKPSVCWKGPSLCCLQGAGAAGGGLECEPVLASAQTPAGDWVAPSPPRSLWCFLQRAAIRGWVPLGHETPPDAKERHGIERIGFRLRTWQVKSAQDPVSLITTRILGEGLRENDLSFLSPVRASIPKLVHPRAALGNS